MADVYWACIRGKPVRAGPIGLCAPIPAAKQLGEKAAVVQSRSVQRERDLVLGQLALEPDCSTLQRPALKPRGRPIT